MFIFRKEKRDTSKRSHPVLTKSSLIWIKLQNLTSFSKGMGKKVVCPFIIKELQKYQNLRLTAMRGSGAGRTAGHLTVLFSQKILAVRSANDIYRSVSGSLLT